MADPADLFSIAESPGAWRDESASTTAAVEAADMQRLADCLDGPPPSSAVPPLWLTVNCLTWPPSQELGADGHPVTGIGYPPLGDRRRMFAGARLEVVDAPHPGQVVTRHTSVSAVRAKQGRSGSLLFVTLAHRFTDASDALLCREEQDLVYRSGPAAPSGAAGDGDGNVAAPCPARDSDLALRADPVRLFRFSALTANSHRIHYDRSYAIEVEGLAGTLVHGPLIGLFLLELARRQAPDRRVRTFDYRLRRPTTSGATLRAHVAASENTDWDVHADVDGVPVATGSIHFEGA